ncbi:MAG: BACON domain-containing protein [Bacteroidales bacterium]|nr:BACON domain-containing protein [Bacteroidales bacterium]
MKKTTLFTIIALLLLQSCDKNYHPVFAPDELGMPKHRIEVDENGGDIEIEFLANKSGTVSLINQEDDAWIKLVKTTFESDGTIPVQVQKNSGFKRRSEIIFVTDTRKDTVSVFQKGAEEDKFYVSAGSMVVFNGGAEVNSVAADINVPLSSIETEIRYSGTEQWITDCKLGNTALTFKTTDNPDKDYMRRAAIFLTYVDGWKETQTLSVTVIQPRADNNIGTVFTPEGLREVATVSGYTLPEDALVDGYIVSTTEGGNAGDAIVADYKQGTGVIDYTLTERTSYLESLDGKYGFRLIANETADNDFQRYSRICLKIGGAVVKKSADEPVQYTIEGVKSSGILTSADGILTMPWKEKSITELTDDDINTLVKIKDCEIAMRKGPFTPVNEGYTLLHGYNRLAKYPILIRDIKGGSMYMFTNMTCPYRRNGETLPYGSGDITGIVVHELYKSFEKDGNIGPYQLRHLIREDIALKPDFKDNFSGLITEFRYAKFPEEDDRSKILATKGNGELRHTYSSINNYSQSFFYIGKCGKDTAYKNKYAEGAGIELDEGGIYQPWVDNGEEASQNTDGKGGFSANQYLSWSNKNWWDSDNDRGYCWLVTFSTEGIASDKVSMQFAMYNNCTQGRSPRYWKAQYSLTTSDTSASHDSEWKDIGTFTVHDVARWGNSGDGVDEWQTLGTRVFDFPLPLEILGRESVSIRLMPRNNKAGGKSVGSYEETTIANGTGYNTMDYFAVRYNK